MEWLLFHVAWEVTLGQTRCSPGSPPDLRVCHWRGSNEKPWENGLNPKPGFDFSFHHEKPHHVYLDYCSSLLTHSHSHGSHTHSICATLQSITIIQLEKSTQNGNPTTSYSPLPVLSCPEDKVQTLSWGYKILEDLSPAFLFGLLAIPLSLCVQQYLTPCSSLTAVLLPTGAFAYATTTTAMPPPSHSPLLGHFLLILWDST